MRTMDFVIKESLRRRRKSIAGISYIVLAVSIFVASQTINKALHDRVKEQLLRFGANIIVQPKGQSFDPYSGTLPAQMLIPENYVDRIQAMDHKEMIVAVSPKLFERFELDNMSLLVVGITPGEKKAKPWWMVGNKVLTDEFPGEREILLGHHTAAHLGGDVSEVRLGDEVFKVIAVLDETGSPDDFMAFVPLAGLQKLSRKVGMVSAIEVSTSCITCKAMNIEDMAKEIGEVLPPDAEVLLVKQIAAAQMGTLKKVQGFALISCLVVLGLCIFLLVNFMCEAVDERRREIGLLLAMGMAPGKIQLIFLSKMLIFAAIGGVVGYVIGSGIAILLGPLVAEAGVSPILYLLPISFAISLGLGVISSIIPLKRISALDPVEALKES